MTSNKTNMKPAADTALLHKNVFRSLVLCLKRPRANMSS